jgi:uncharacterized phage protein (TIGR01671 family)
MREIKFRGKRVNNGEWVYGDLIHRYSNWIYIAPIPSTIEITPIEIDPETVGQYTGLKDKNGKEIYEGDIVEIKVVSVRKEDKWDGETGEYLGWEYVEVPFKDIKIVEWLGDGFNLFYGNWIEDEFEVIGNIFDNPELLKGEKLK